MQEAVRQRPAPLVTDDLGADHDVAERARHALGKLLAAVDREREHVRHLVELEMLALERAHLVLTDEGDSQLAVGHTLRAQHLPRELDRGGLVDLHPAPVRHLDGDHRFRSSVCSLYASTMRWTSLWRTTSRWPNSMKLIPSMLSSTSRTCRRPE